jgi:hypothetical protein
MTYKNKEEKVNYLKGKSKNLKYLFDHFNFSKKINIFSVIYKDNLIKHKNKKMILEINLKTFKKRLLNFKSSTKT